MNSLHDELRATTERWPVAATAAVRGWARETLRDAAEVSSRRVLAEAKAELANRALWRFVDLCYDGAPALWYNVSHFGRVEVPTPWSRSRCYDYGLTDVAGRLLRVHMVGVLESLPERRRLFWFDGQYWHLNRGGFPALPAAQEWIGTVGIVTAARWDALSQAYPNGRKAGR